MTTTSTTSLEATTVKTITLELPAQVVERLRLEYERLSRDANPALAWSRFLQGCVAIGLDQLQRMSALEVFELVDRLDATPPED